MALQIFVYDHRRRRDDMFKPKLSTLTISVTTSKPPAFANPHLLLHQSRIVGEVGIRGSDNH